MYNLKVADFVDIKQNLSSFDVEDMVHICKRKNNAKRQYLFVNKYQGKHIPIDPTKVSHLYVELFEQIGIEFAKDKIDANNVSVYAIRGNFDDAQTGVKKIFSDKALAEKALENGFFFSSANSINWGRLAPQIVYYVSAYCDLLTEGKIKMGDKINVCVPTGNFGNIFAAYIAKKMGLPVGKLVCASNSNNVLTEFLESGTYDKNRSFHATISPSMDILIFGGQSNMQG